MHAKLNTTKDWKQALVAVIIVVWCAGCTSTRTTLFNEAGCDHRTKHIAGVPTSVEVPTHVRITIHETHYVKFTTSTTDGKDDPTKKPTLKLLASSTVPGTSSSALATRHASYELVRHKETFAVDVVRPAAGSIVATYVFGDSKSPNHQKLTRLDTAVEDKTIDAITGLIRNTVLVAQRKQVAAQQSAAQERTTLVPIKSDIACEFFDIRDPALTDRIQAFLDLHVNECHNPCPVLPR